VFDRKNPSESFLAKEMIFEDSKHPIIWKETFQFHRTAASEH
jgi:hypothetical protein